MNPQYVVREAWTRFKEAAQASGESLTDAITLTAISKWAEHEAGAPGGPNRGLREALSASISGAALVDLAVEKLAAQGRYTSDERDFLLDLNADAAIGDLRQLLKTSSAFGDLLRSPVTRGAIGGALVGGGVGALKDEDNRARGAILYGVPGAAMGALAGHGYGQWRGARQQATQEQAKKLVDEATTAKQTTDDWNHKLHQGRQWAQAQDAAHALQAGAPAAEKLKSQEDAFRWYHNLLASADMFTSNSDKTTQEYAKHLKQKLRAYQESIIEHSVENPQSVHKILIQAAGVDGGQKTLNSILSHARMLHKNGN